MFEFLFKYPLSFFQEGTVQLSTPWWVPLLAFCLGIILVPSLLRYWAVRGKSRLKDRLILLSLRSLLVALLVFCLCQPFLLHTNTVEQRGVVAVLLDNSLSMQIADYNGEPRNTFISRAFSPQPGELLTRLAERFDVRLFSFGLQTKRIEAVSDLEFISPRTDLGGALIDTANQLQGASVSGIVLVSDGADNSAKNLQDALLKLSAGALPVYTIGVGSEQFARDIELGEINLPRRILQGDAIEAQFPINHSGYSGSTLPIIVEDAGQIIHREEITLGDGSKPVLARLRFTPPDTGPRRLVFRIAPQADEQLLINNSREVLLHIRDAREKILYFEGEPRFELKFLRRAVNDDKNLAVSALLRTASNKFYRLGIENPEDLKAGFPSTKEELFGYRGLIVGSIEAAHFAPEQLQMISDFAAVRGGGLLLLGGKKGFARGGYANTPLVDALPVIMPDGFANGFNVEARIMPTETGASHPILQLDGDAEVTARRWDSLPRLTILNPVYDTKPGATVLLHGITDGGSTDPLVALAWQRFGRGRVAALTTQDTWLWQMHPEIDVEDQTHETFWRQLLRWLVSATAERLTITPASDLVTSGEALAITVDLVDRVFQPQSGASPEALLTSPTGVETELELQESISQSGRYGGVFVGQEEGLHEIRVRWKNEEESLAAATFFQVDNKAFEYYQAQTRPALLQRIADETGGQYLPAAQSQSLPDALEPLNRGVKVTERLELWDMPALFLLLILLISSEWIYRRMRGLP